MSGPEQVTKFQVQDNNLTEVCRLLHEAQAVKGFWDGL